MTLNNLAVLTASGPQCADAAPLYRRALAIFEACLAPTHPKILTCRQNYAQLLRQLRRCTTATALPIRTRAAHPRRDRTAGARRASDG